MPDYATVAARLEASLALRQPPIAVATADEVPAGVSPFEGHAPAGCLFWQRASEGPIATSTSDHELCAIGVHTHQLAAPSADCRKELGEVLAVLSDLDYVRESEVARIPVLPRPSRHVIYAPLGATPVEPEVVLLFVDARHGLIVTEAVEQIEQGLPPALGRPACAAIPQAVNTGRAALSLGCCGARAYLDVLSDDVAMWALPGGKLEAYTERITVLAEANATLSRFHQQRRRDVESGSRPTVKESLDRMG